MERNKKSKSNSIAYRPTVRYNNIYRTYVDALFKTTTLDRNQIIRCALFAAAYNNRFLELMSHYKKGDVPLPSPLWQDSDHQLWLEQGVLKEEEGGIKSDFIEGKRTNSSTTKLFEAPTDSRSIPGTVIQSRQQHTSNNETSEQNRRQQSIERRTGALPAIQLANNRGIRIDFR
ncbi:hypothetical protein [Priestia aryabhattai]|uniref:hypothetical protein n=1 Tax=Priestia aryabhattai TaxID=412384 RepID=UPI001FB559D2|nr:hypothetical protein [Priestia aryabhattai]